MKYVSQRPGFTGQRAPLRLLGVFFLLLGTLMAVSISSPVRVLSGSHPTVTFSGPPLLNATSGSAITAVTFTATGLTEPISFSVVGPLGAATLPEGLTLTTVSATATISGTPTTTTSALTCFQVEAVGTGGTNRSSCLDIRVLEQPTSVDFTGTGTVDAKGERSLSLNVGTPMTPLEISTTGMTGPVTFSAVARNGGNTNRLGTHLPNGLSIVTTSATTALIEGTPSGEWCCKSEFRIAASDNAVGEVLSSETLRITVLAASNNNNNNNTNNNTNNTGTNTGAVFVPDPPPAPTPATTVPAPVGVGESDLITEQRQGQLASPVGDAKLLVGGELVDVALTQASSDLRTVAPAERTAAQVSELQSLAASMVAELQGALGADATLPISVRDTPTGAVIVGLARNPVTGEPMDVPVEDVVLVAGGGLVLMASGVDGQQSAKIGLDGAIEIPEGGQVSVIAGGLTPGADGEVVVMSTPRLISDFAVGTSGEVAEQAALPADLPLGDHTVVVTVGDEAASLGFRLVAASTPDATGVVATLPATGSDGITGSWAVLFLALGALALLMSTRRRTA